MTYLAHVKKARTAPMIVESRDQGCSALGRSTAVVTVNMATKAKQPEILTLFNATDDDSRILQTA